MTPDEKLAVLSGNIRGALSGDGRKNAFLEGNLYELARMAAASDDYSNSADVARLVIPSDETEMLARFCLQYQKVCGNGGDVFPRPETAERSRSVAIPEIVRLHEALGVIASHGIQLEAEHGDSFASCAEDVEFGHSRYVIMPLRDPEEGRLRAFDRLRGRYGLKIHCVVYIIGEGGGEFAYQLCGSGYPDSELFPPSKMYFSADTECDPVRFLRSAEIIGASICSAEFEKYGTGCKVTAVLDIENMDKTAQSALLMYLNMSADITIDGCYAELR